MSDFLGSFLENMQVMTKHVEKSCVGLWGQLLILEVSRYDFQGLGKDYLWRVIANKDVE